jgi:Short C-terminal domain
MTTGPAAGPQQDNSLVGVSAGLVAAAAAGFLCNWTGEKELTQYVVPLAVSLAMATPPAVQLRIKSRHRDRNADIARIEHGELRRPVALVVMLLAAAILLFDSAAGFILTVIHQELTRAGGREIGIAKVVGLAFETFVPIILGLCFVLVASYASHYFARRPYLWTTIAVGCALAVRELVVLRYKSALGGLFATVLSSAVLVYVGILFICLVGTWLGRRYHDAFLAKKLVRIEGKAARQQFTPQSQTTTTQASPPDSNAPQDSAPKLATFVSPGALPSAPDGHRISDPIKQIEKLAHLRDAGALTEEEFQAKKTEILCRI